MTNFIYTEQQIPFDAKYYQDHQQPLDTVLESNIDYQIPVDNPLIQGSEYSVSAIIATSRGASLEDDSVEQFLLLDLRNTPRDQQNSKEFMGYGIDPSVEFMLVSKDMSIADGFGFKGIRRGEEVSIGRNAETANRFKLSGYVSGDHFSVRLGEDGQIRVNDHASSNGTKVYAKEVLQPEAAKSNGKQEARDDSYWSYEQSQAREQERARNNDQSKSTSPPNDDEKKGNPLADATAQFPEIHTEDAASILYAIESMEKEGLDAKQIKRSLYREWHPDGAPQGSPESQRRHTATQLIGILLDGRK